MHASPRSSIIRSRHSRLAIRRNWRHTSCVEVASVRPATGRLCAGCTSEASRHTSCPQHRQRNRYHAAAGVRVLAVDGRNRRHRLPCVRCALPRRPQTAPLAAARAASLLEPLVARAGSSCAHDHQRSLEKALANRIDSRATMEVALNSFNAANFFPDRVSRSGRWRQLWPAARSRSWRRTTIRQRQMPRHPRPSQWRRQ